MVKHIEETKKCQIDSMVHNYFYYDHRKKEGYDTVITEEQYSMLEEELTKVLNKYCDMHGKINKVEGKYVKHIESDGTHFE